MNFARKTSKRVHSFWLPGLSAACILSLFVNVAQAQMFVADLNDPVTQDAGDSYGCSLVDVNGDGFLDLFVANEGEANDPNIDFFYLNDGAGNFTKVENLPITSVAGMSRSGLWADMNNDGLLDLYVVNRDYQHNFFFLNTGTTDEPSFQKISEGPHVNDGIDENVFAGSSLDADIGDYDRDGFLDIVVVNRDRERNFLFRNLAGNGFQKVNGLAITEDREASRGCSWIDMDNDGDLDLYVFNDRQPNTSYRNDGDKWTRRTGGLLPLVQGRARGAVWGDYNNDGLIDAAVVHSNEYNLLYQSFGSGIYQYQGDALPATEGGACVSAAWGDYDNDADLDLIFSNTGDRNLMYRNDGGVFTRVTDEPPAIDVAQSTGLAFADIDNNGFLDLFISNRRGENNQLYRNQGNSNGWVKVALRGFGSNRKGIGSVVRVTAEIGGQTVEQMRILQTRSGPLSQSGLEVHFGLADATEITEISVQFPSGDVQTLNNQAINTRYLIEESPTTSVGRPALSSIDFAVTPHPLNSAAFADAQISWMQSKAGMVAVELFTPNGSLVRRMPSRWMQAGPATLQLSELQGIAGTILSPGIYLLRISGEISGGFASYDAAIVIGGR